MKIHTKPKSFIETKKIVPYLVGLFICQLVMTCIAMSGASADTVIENMRQILITLFGILPVIATLFMALELNLNTRGEA